MNWTIGLRLITVLGGLVMLYGGSRLLIHGAIGLANMLHVSQLVIGLTIVAFGTSSPELFVSLISAISGYEAISIGNVIGSNIINIAFILALASLFAPIIPSKRAIAVEIPLMFAGYLCLTLVIIDIGNGHEWHMGIIRRFDGILLVMLLIAYTLFQYRSSKPPLTPAMSTEPITPTSDRKPANIVLLVLCIAIGVALLAGGARLLVTGAVWLAREVLHISERLIAITIVAIGTSLPELFTSIVAGIKGKHDISLGNLIGSNIFNSLLVPGLAAIIQPIAISSDFRLDFVAMLITSLALFIMLMIKKRVGRFGGILLLTGYIVYLVVSLAGEVG